MRPPRSRCSGRRGEHPAGRAGGDHRHLRRRPADRGAAAHRGAPPAAAGPHPAGRDDAVPGRSAARAPDPGPRRADRPARARPGPARRDRRTGRPARTCSPTGRPSAPSAWSQTPWPRTSPTACHRRPSPRICDDLLEASIPGSVQGRQHVAGRRLDRRGNLLPAPVPRHPRLRRPRGLLGAPLRRRPRPGQRAVLRLLRLGRHHDARRARPAGARAGPPDDRLLLPPRPGPRPGPGADRDARSRHPARRHPGRLRLRPPRRRRLGHPAPRSPARSWSRTCTRSTAAPAAPTTAPSSPTATSTARPPPARCWNSARWPATPPPARPPRTTSSPPSWPGYKLGPITSDDADGYHRVMCPAAMGKIRCPLRPASMTLDPRPARDPHPARAPARLLHPADHHRAAPGRGQDPAETRLPLGGAPAVLRPAHRRRADLLHRQGPRQQQHRPRLDPAHGPGTRSCSGSPACSPSATSAS